MALVGINPARPRSRKPTTLEQIALGVDIGTKVLGTGISGYDLLLKGQKADREEAATTAGIYDKFRPAKAGEASEFDYQGTGMVRREPEYTAKDVLTDLQIQKTRADLQEKNIALPKKIEQAQYGKPLERVTRDNLSEAATLPQMLQETYSIIEKRPNLFGPARGYIGEINPYDADAQKVKANTKATTQIVGKFLEDGVLRKEDEAKYRAMMPQLTDTPEVAKTKAAIISKMIRRKFESMRDSAKAGGFDTRYFDNSPLINLQLPEWLGGSGQSEEDIAQEIVGTDLPKGMKDLLKEGSPDIENMTRDEKIRLLQKMDNRGR